MGIEPMTPVLPRLCATAAPHGQVGLRWAVRDSNPRSRRQLIYSQPHLATLVTAQDEKPFNPSIRKTALQGNWWLKTLLHSPQGVLLYLQSDRRTHYSRPFVPCQAFFLPGTGPLQDQETRGSRGRQGNTTLPELESRAKNYCVLHKLLV